MLPLRHAAITVIRPPFRRFLLSRAFFDGYAIRHPPFFFAARCCCRFDAAAFYFRCFFRFMALIFFAAITLRRYAIAFDYFFRH